LMVVEHAPEESRNFYASWPQMGAPAGLVLSTAVFTAFSSLSDEQFFAWGWRVPFLLSIILIGVGLFIRLRVLESPAFERVKELGTESRVPLLEVLRGYPVAALLAIGVVLVNIGGYYIVITFTLSYVTETLGVARNVPLIGLLLAGFAEIAGILISARLSDPIGRRPAALWGTAIILLLAFPFFWLVNTEVLALIWLAMSLWTFWAGAFYGITGVFIAELFEGRVRYSGISFGYQMAGMLGSALAPIIATALLRWADGVAAYLAADSLINLVAVYLASENYGVGIFDERVSERIASEQG
jgi:MHS family shikimate/dehydroshikimate transporter-like MFS transporter